MRNGSSVRSRRKPVKVPRPAQRESVRPGTWVARMRVSAGNMMGSGDLSTTDQTRASACDSRLSKSGGAVGVLSSSPKPSASLTKASGSMIRSDEAS